MNYSKTLVLALTLASAATIAAASDDSAGRDYPASAANSVDGTGTFSVNPRFPGTLGENAGPDPADMTAEPPLAADWKPVAEPATIANRYAWSANEVYLPTPQPQSVAETPAEPTATHR